MHVYVQCATMLPSIRRARSNVSNRVRNRKCADERAALSFVTEVLGGCCQQQITAATQHPPLSAACWATCCAAAIESTYTQPQIQIQIQWHARADTLRLRRTTKTRTQATERLTVACGQAARLDVTKPRESNAIKTAGKPNRTDTNPKPHGKRLRARLVKPPQTPSVFFVV